MPQTVIVHTDLDEDDFYEEDESVEQLRAAFAGGEKFRTARRGRVAVSGRSGHDIGWMTAVGFVCVVSSLVGGTVALLSGHVAVAVAIVLTFVTTVHVLLLVLLRDVGALSVRIGALSTRIEVVGSRRRTHREHKA
jgi:hypothetical protein